MSKAEEIALLHISNFRETYLESDKQEIYEAMKAYSLACLERASIEASLNYWTNDIDRDSIFTEDNLV